MSKIIAIAPNGDKYACDTVAEAQRVRAGKVGKSRNPATWTVSVWNEAVRRGHYTGTFASLDEAKVYQKAEASNSRSFVVFEVWTGTPKNPIARVKDVGALRGSADAVRNPSSGAKQRGRGVREYDELAGGLESRGNWHARMVGVAESARSGGKRGGGKHLHAWALRLAKKARPKLPNPHPQSEDFSLGLFAGAMEFGHLPPDKRAPADYRAGYAAGAQIAEQHPQKVIEALGVFKGSRNHRLAGEMLRESITDGPGVVLQNPGMSRKQLVVALYKRFSTSDKRIQHGQHKVMLTGPVATVLSQPQYANVVLENLTDEQLNKLAGTIGLRRNPSSGAKQRKRGTRVSPRFVMAKDVAAGDDHTHHLKRAAEVRWHGAAARKEHGKHLSRAAANRPKLPNPAPVLAAIPVGVTLQIGKHRVRNLGKGDFVVDGVRCSKADAVSVLKQT